MIKIWSEELSPTPKLELNNQYSYSKSWKSNWEDPKTQTPIKGCISRWVISDENDYKVKIQNVSKIWWSLQMTVLWNAKHFLSNVFPMHLKFPFHNFRVDVSIYSFIYCHQIHRKKIKHSNSFEKIILVCFLFKNQIKMASLVWTLGIPDSWLNNWWWRNRTSFKWPRWNFKSSPVIDHKWRHTQKHILPQFLISFKACNVKS